MKAFLSHSSKDKELVSKVAKELGRQFCIFDKLSFENGIEFKQSIEEGLSSSSVFVLFASQNSLKSLWVKHEVTEAWYEKLQENLSTILVYIIDSGVRPADLPEWLQRALISTLNAPNSIARDIKYHLDELIINRSRSYFVGRSKEIQDLQEFMAPIDGSPIPHAIIIRGLTGIGRRSLIRYVVPDLLQLRKFIEIRIDDGTTINDVCAMIANYIESYSTQDRLKKLIAEIQALSQEDALNRTLSNLRKATEQHELVIMIDQGGMFESDGYLTHPIRSILQALEPNDDGYLFLVTNRKPKDDERTIPRTVHVREFSQNETKRLLTLLASNEGVAINTMDLNELADYVAGYPPAAYYAVHQAKEYGWEVLKARKGILVEYRRKIFVEELKRIELTEIEIEILRLLAFYSPLPLHVIGRVYGIAPEDLSDILIHFIDLSLATADEAETYKIADPIIESAAKTFGIPLESEHQALAKELLIYLKHQKDVPLLELNRVLFRAARLCNDFNVAKQAASLSNDLIALTKQLYYDRRYKEAIELGKQVLEEQPRLVTARRFVISGLIKTEQWKEANEQIETFGNYAPQRDVQFFIGFLARGQNLIQSAISAYLNSERLGRRDVPLKRELALCFYIQRDFARATRYVREALKLQPDNSHVLDLWAQIAIAQRDEKMVAHVLDRLREIGSSWYYHRLSMAYSYIYDDPIAAESSAQQAIDTSGNSIPFEFLTHMANCKIAVSKYTDAEIICEQLDTDHRGVRNDIQLNLRSRLENAQGRYRRALDFGERVMDKSSLYYKRIRQESLLGELQVSALSDKQRAAYEYELEHIKGELNRAQIHDEFLPLELLGLDFTDLE